MSELSTSITRKNIIVSERANPLWERVLATVFYLVSLYGFYIYATNINFTEVGDIAFGSFIMLVFQGISLTIAFQLSAISAIHFDLDQNKYKKVYNIGLVQFGLWKTLPFIEYLSIMYYTGTYEAHLKFLDEEEHIIFYADSYTEIFSLAYDTAKQINVGLFDNVMHHRESWVNMSKDKTELLKEVGLYQEPEAEPSCVLSSDKYYTKGNINEVTEGQKPFYKRVLSALFFTIGSYYILSFCLVILIMFDVISFHSFRNIFTPRVILLSLAFLVPALASISFCREIIVVHKYQFDIKNNIFRKVSDYGWFKKKNQWKCIPDTDYISIYYQATDNGYEISLFQTNKKAIELFSGNSLGETFRLGYEVAKILDVELLNATNWDEQYWVDFNKTEEELFQELIQKNK